MVHPGGERDVERETEGQRERGREERREGGGGTCGLWFQRPLTDRRTDGSEGGMAVVGVVEGALRSLREIAFAATADVESLFSQARDDVKKQMDVVRVAAEKRRMNQPSEKCRYRITGNENRGDKEKIIEKAAKRLVEAIRRQGEKRRNMTD